MPSKFVQIAVTTDQEVEESFDNLYALDGVVWWLRGPHDTAWTKLTEKRDE